MNLFKIIISFVATFFISLSIPDLTSYSVVGIFIFIFFGIHFFSSLGKTIPIRTLMVLISTLQWIIGPILAYHFYPDSYDFYMIIPEEEYMPYVVSAQIAFTIGLYVFSLKEPTKIGDIFANIHDINQLYKKGWILIIIGTIATISIKILPASLAFFLLLISYSKYIGAFYLFMTNEPLKWVWILIAFSFEFMKAFGGGLFHDLILWLLYLYIIYAYISKISTFNKLISLSLIISFVFVIQYIKEDYRAVIWGKGHSQSDTEKIAFATDLAQEKLLEDRTSFEQQDKMQDIVDRINQGWIIARIMHHVPHYEPFAGGETINEGLKAAVLPRILAPNKKTTGGQEYFPRFTGLILSEGTSMDLSIVGEAYANYGVVGGVFFMFILGLFYNLTLKFVTKKALTKPELLLWIPVIYFYTIKAESDFTTSINHITKASIVVYIMVKLLDKLVPQTTNTNPTFKPIKSY